MAQVDSSTDVDLDIDLESGGTSDEDTTKSKGMSFENSKKVLGRIKSGFMSSESLCESTNVGDCSYPYNKFITSDEISTKNEKQLEKFREEMRNFVHKKMDKEKPKKNDYTKSSKPPLPPRGPSLDASDMKLLKEISELNLKRKRMERRRTLRRTKKEKASSLSSNLIACLVTIIFILVIIFQGLLGSRV